MKLVYSHPNSMMVGSIAGLLAQAGIETQIRNEILGGAAGEISPNETWVELWVVDPTRVDQALAMISSLSEQSEGENWICKNCQEKVPATFEVCWQCGTTS